jgi:hypothetical protein
VTPSTAHPTRRLPWLPLWCVALAAIPARAQVNYTGGGYVQNFDTLASAPANSAGVRWTNNVTLPGWYADRTTFAVTNGTLGGSAEAFDDTAVAANSGLFSFGAADSPERALGTRAATNAPVRIGVRLVNQTGQTLTRFSVSYTGEQWFKSSAATAHTLVADYLFDASSLQAGGWTRLGALTFTSPVTSAGAAALDGNAPGNSSTLVATVSGITWAPGQELWIRFSDLDEAGAEHGLAVDNFALWTGDDSAVFFNGTNRYITMGRAPALGLAEFTLECWFLQTGPGITTSSGTGGATGVPLVTKGRAEADGSNLDCNYFFALDAQGRLVADFEARPASGITAGDNFPIVGTNSAIPGIWNHAAATYDGSTWRLYLNGELDASRTLPAGASPRADSIQHFGIGSALNSTGVAAGFFQGAIDEVRVWHVARSPAEILATRDSPITTEAAGLVARYALNEGTGAAIGGFVAGAPGGTISGGAAWVAGRRFAPNLPPSVELTAPTPAYRGMFPATVPFAANAIDPDGATVLVEFFVDGRKIGQDATPPFTFNWTQVPAGTYAVMAAATDNSGARTTSAPVSITVAPNPNRPPTVTLASPAPDEIAPSATTTLVVNLADPERAATRVTFYGRKTVPPTPGPDFTLGTLPDTQYYSENVNGRSRHFLAQTQWYVTNRESLNLAFVSHMGDIVDHGDVHDVIRATNLPEWQIADAALRILEDPLTTLRAHGIPWGAAPGNHDQTPNGSAAGTTTLYNQFFGIERFARRPYYGGHYGTNNNNNYQLFSASGLEFLILHLEYDTRPLETQRPVLDWADSVLKAYPARRAIVTSHWMVNTGNPATFSAQGRLIYEHLRNNSNLFLLLGGHINGEGRRSDVFQGRTVHSVLQDYQFRANGGDGWLRTFTFSPSRNAIFARTYSPSLDQYETDGDSEFSLPYDMQRAVSEWIPLGSVDVPPGGTSASLAWTGLEPGSHYEWHATVQDEINLTTSATRRFASNSTAVPTVEITSPAPRTRVPIPAIVRLVASARSESHITRVEFFQGNTRLGEDTTAPFEFAWAGPATGDYELSAVATDETGASSRSAFVPITVFNPNNRAPIVALTSPANGTRLTHPANLTLAATAADSDGTIASVEFFDGPVKLGESRTAPYTFTWALATSGRHTVTVRATDNDGGTATSAPVELEVVSPVVGTLIAANSIWKYLDNGSDQGTAWRALAFNDSSWPSGAAELGYGDGDETTVVGFGPNPVSRSITTYFRRTFTVADPARVGQLVLNLVRDDGAIVYLNGVEIGRSNLPSGTTFFYNTLAPTAVEGPDESTFFPLAFSTDPRELLVPGTNTLAVEVHQQAITNSDLSFNLELLDHRLPVGAPPAVALTAPAPRAEFATTDRIALAATATDPDGSIARVVFFAGGTRLGESAAAPFTATWTAPTAGTHLLLATATDNQGNVISSLPVPIVVREANPGRFVNFSIRNNVGAGSGTLIVGFVTGGPGTSGEKPLFLRAVGPSLSAFGVTNFSTDPVATLATDSSIVAVNDNWAGNPDVIRIGAQVGAFPLANTASRDAALVVTRPSGPQTLQITGTAGTALAEIYDATPTTAFLATTPRLVNVSARALVATGTNELIAGVVVGGATSRTVLIRAIGPSLSLFGVTGDLANPRLEIYRAGSSTPIAENDDWGGGAVLTTAMVRVGAFALPPTSRDAAVLATFAPGAYTARVTGAAGTSGVALVDIYEVP